jgi:amino acid transporter
MIMTDSEVVAEQSDKRLRRGLNTWDLLFLSLGGIIGSGWLFAAYAASSIAGPAAILS